MQPETDTTQTPPKENSGTAAGVTESTVAPPDSVTNALGEYSSDSLGFALAFKCGPIQCAERAQDNCANVSLENQFEEPLGSVDVRAFVRRTLARFHCG
jgi:hypothetical protein